MESSPENESDLEDDGLTEVEEDELEDDLDDDLDEDIDLEKDEEKGPEGEALEDVYVEEVVHAVDCPQDDTCACRDEEE